MEILYKTALEHAGALLILAFLAITFLQSGYDKVSDWRGNVTFLTAHFKETAFKNWVPVLLAIILFFEIVVGLMSLLGMVLIYVNQNTFIAFIACVLAAKVLLALLLGQRIAKDYAGAMTIVVYFIVAVMGVILLQ